MFVLTSVTVPLVIARPPEVDDGPVEITPLIVIGVVPTIALVLLTAVTGATLLRMQGLATVRSIQLRLANGQLPGQELLEGALLLIGGALLLTPGFVTDVMGLLVLIPASRRALVRALLKRGVLEGMILGSAPRHGGATSTPGFSTIEGEFKQEDPSPEPRRGELP